jgi:WD40 repeat protein
MEQERDFSDNNPFPGIRPFSPGDSDLFFGRDAERDEIILKLLKNRYITVIGPSGCGKSSLIFGGVLPKIITKKTKESAIWRTISFKPGNDPFENLANALSSGIAEPGQKIIDKELILSELLNDPVSLSDVVRKYMIRPDDNILFVIDQFEELFRYLSAGKPEISKESIKPFIDFLLNSVITPDVNVFIVLTMRSEYLGECSQYKGLTTLVNNSNYLVPDMTDDNYREVIIQPIVHSGAKIDPELVDTLVHDLQGKTWKLPILQHALMRTWDHWKKPDQPDKPVSKSDYNLIGTLNNAISVHADAVFDDMNQVSKDICAAMFKVIARKDTDNKGQRNPSDINTLRSIAGCTTEELFNVINKFRAPSIAFITPEQDVPLQENTVIDLKSENLIKLWGRLQAWVEDETASKDIYLRLSDASALYQQGKSGLLRSPDLEPVIQWRNKVKPTLAWAVQYNPAFERAMVYLRTSEKAYLIEEQNKVILQTQKIKRNRMITRILSIAILVTGGFMLFAYFQKLAAERHTVLAEQQRVEAEKGKAIADSFAVIVLKQKMVSDSTASASVQEAEEARQQKVVAEVQKSLAEKSASLALFQKKQALLKSDSIKAASQAVNESAKIAVEQRNETQRLRMLSMGKAMSLRSINMTDQKELQPILAFQAYLFNRKNNGSDNDADIYAGLYNASLKFNGTGLSSFRGHNGDIRSIAFLPGKREFFTSGNDGKVLRWSLDKKDQALQIVYSGTDIINVLAVSPDASWLACGSSGSSIKMIPINGTGSGFELNGHTGGIKSLIFSYDGKSLYSAAGDGKVLKWNVAARTSMNVSSGSMEISSIDISLKGNYIAGISTDGKVQVWNPDQKTDNFRIETTGKNITVVKFNPDNNLLALGDADGSIELWDVILHKKVAEVKAHGGQVNDIEFNPALKQMATAGNDKKIRIFDIKDPSDLTEPPITLADNEGIVVVMQFSPDGHLILSGESGGSGNISGRPANTDYMAENMCNIVTRNMTQDEWNIYVAKDIPLEKTCMQKNFNIKVEPIKATNR